MTEGTSQGLFIVVSIVIFGIFVSLSYTLFGKTLQPQIVGIFEKSTEQTIDDFSLHKKLDSELFHSDFKNANDMIFDFKRVYTDTNLSTGSYNGEGGVYDTETDTYTLKKTRILYGRPAKAISLDRVYMNHGLEHAEKYDLVKGVMYVDGVKYTTNTGSDSLKPFKNKQPVGFGMRYMMFSSGLELESNKLYKIKVRLYTKNNEYFEFNKNIIVEE